LLPGDAVIFTVIAHAAPERTVLSVDFYGRDGA